MVLRFTSVDETLSGAFVIVNWQSEVVRFFFFKLEVWQFFFSERVLIYTCGMSIASEAGSLQGLIQVSLYLLIYVPRYNV